MAIRTAATRNVTGGSDRCTVLRPTEKFSFVSATASTGFTTCPLPQRSPLVPKAHIKSVVYPLGMRAAGLLFLGEFIRTYRFSPYPRPWPNRPKIPIRRRTCYYHKQQTPLIRLDDNYIARSDWPQILNNCNNMVDNTPLTPVMCGRNDILKSGICTLWDNKMDPYPTCEKTTWTSTGPLVTEKNINICA